MNSNLILFFKLDCTLRSADKQNNITFKNITMVQKDNNPILLFVHRNTKIYTGNLNTPPGGNSNLIYVITESTERKVESIIFSTIRTSCCRTLPKQT